MVYGTGMASYGIVSRVFAITGLPYTEEKQIVIRPGESWTTITQGTDYSPFEKSRIQLYKE